MEGTEEEDSDSESCSTSGQQNRNQYPELCKATDRANVSNRDACLLANAVLKDLELLSPENALHPCKLRCQRSAWRKKSVEIHKQENQGIVCLGFDGKIDLTLTQASSTRRKISSNMTTYCVLQLVFKMRDNSNIYEKFNFGIIFTLLWTSDLCLSGNSTRHLLTFCPTLMYSIGH